MRGFLDIVRAGLLFLQRCERWKIMKQLGNILVWSYLILFATEQFLTDSCNLVVLPTWLSFRGNGTCLDPQWRPVSCFPWIRCHGFTSEAGGVPMVPPAPPPPPREDDQAFVRRIRMTYMDKARPYWCQLPIFIKPGQSIVSWCSLIWSWWSYM